MIISREEDNFFDFKSKEDINKCEKTASAFANADGGELVVGIRDKKESDRFCALFSDPEEANGCITQLMNVFSDGPEFINCEFYYIPKMGYFVYFIIQRPLMLQKLLRVASLKGKMLRTSNRKPPLKLVSLS